jgi:hypothetical protein
MLYDNLIVTGQQMAGCKQVSEILNKFFQGYTSSLSIELLTNAVELHYEGLSMESKKML